MIRKLLESTEIGDIHLSNCMVMAPMTRSRADTKGVPMEADRATMYGGGEHGYTDYPPMSK